MSRGVKFFILAGVALILGAGLLLAGVILGRMSVRLGGFGVNWQAFQDDRPGSFGLLPFRFPLGHMWDWRVLMGRGMMDRLYERAETPERDWQWGPGMMGGYGMGPGMMGGYSGWDPDVDPLTLDQARRAVEATLDRWGDEPLVVGEIMIFDNHAYAQLVEGSTATGALEVIVDPITLDVYPEMGPTMMWNVRYSPMGRYGGMMGSGMMRGFWPPGEIESVADMPVSAEEAVQYAQRYLDEALPGAQSDEHADPFYGYYTLHVLRGGEVVGMLSVNGFSGEIFPHTWHGELIEMSAE